MKPHCFGLPLPNPRSAGDLQRLQWVFEAALEARSSLLQEKAVGGNHWPIAAAADQVAFRWCNARRHGLIPNDAQDQAWLASAITEILSLDPVTREFLRGFGMPAPGCAWCRCRIGGSR